MTMNEMVRVNQKRVAEVNRRKLRINKEIERRRALRDLRS